MEALQSTRPTTTSSPQWESQISYCKTFLIICNMGCWEMEQHLPGLRIHRDPVRRQITADSSSCYALADISIL
jgi:hypothetical protein